MDWRGNMLYNIGDRKIEIRGAEYFIAESADIIGSVTIEDKVSIWYNTVIRGDIGLITIGEGTNIQDGCVLHTDFEGSLTVGKYVSAGHSAILHNCTIGDNTLIGMNAVVLSSARVGKNCIIGAGSLVTGGREIPDNSLVLGSPGRVIRVLTADEVQNITNTALRYIDNFRLYKNALQKL
jgi:carbonic anhydrase/acetyltransferase-like protein (isoleucine patch superfamily)